MSEGGTSPTSPGPSRRRGSFADMFSNARSARPSLTAGATSAYPASITTAAAQANQQRRLSIGTLGLSGSPQSRTTPFGSLGRSRGESMSSGIEENANANTSAVEDADASATSSGQTSPFARRMSFGAQAMGQLSGRQGNAGSPTGTGTSPSLNNDKRTPPGAGGKGRGLC